MEINWSDVMSVLKLVAPYLWALGAALAIAIALTVTAKKWPPNRRFFVRGQTWLAFALVAVVIVNLICVGPMSTMLSLVSGSGAVTEETIQEAREIAARIAEEGVVLLENDGLLPLSADAKVNVFGWSSTNPYYGGTGSGGFSDKFKTTTLLDSLTAAGLEYNAALSDFYTAYRADRPEIGLFSQDWTLPEPPLDTYPDELLTEAKDFSSTALLVLSRSGGEGADLPKDVNAEGVLFTNNSESYKEFEDGAHILQLSRTERDLVNMVCGNYEDVILLYCGANTLELGFIKEYPSIRGVIWCQGLGQEGMTALGEILTGAVNPSGRTSDTFMYDMTQTPWYNNFGDFAFDNAEEFTAEALVGMVGPHFLHYVEGIYVGYRFYETADAEGFLDYDSAVQYPFGYGLSYTSFTQTMGDLQEADGVLSVDVTVTNTGNVPGKDAVQIYYTAPYTNGGIEKAAVNLGAFAKTDLLAPGQSQTLTLTLTVEGMASYDAYGHGCYALEEGDYILSLRSDSHTVIDQRVWNVPATIIYDENNKRDTDAVAAVNRFDNAAGGVTYLSRADGFANYAEATAAPATLSMSDEIKAIFVTTNTYDPFAHNNPDDVMPVTGAKNGMTLAQMRGKSYDDPDWEKLLDQLTVKEMTDLIALGGYQTIAVNSIGKLSTTDCDGPASITNNFTGESSIGMPSSVTLACTFNEALALEYGEIMGKMLVEMQVAGWYAPAMNMHRTPLGGREFEYVSEDGLLTGKLIAQEVIGAAEYGVYSYVKHFAMNDQETNRWFMCTIWAPEQAIREIYLKPFEIAIKEGGATGVMSAYSYIGPNWSGGNDGLLNKVLRDEWGFRGMVITDYFLGLNSMSADIGIRNGNDLCLIAYDTGDNYPKDQTSATSVQAMRTASKNICYTVVNGRTYAEETSGGGLLAWQVWLIVCDCVCAAVLAYLELLLIRKYRTMKA